MKYRRRGSIGQTILNTALTALLVLGCEDDGDDTRLSDAGAGTTGGGDAGLPDGATDGATDGAIDGPASGPCAACGPGQRCFEDTCIPDALCTTANDCQNDSYCAGGFCAPWGLPAATVSDQTCQRAPAAAAFAIELQCAFETPPAGEAPESNQVMVTAAVIDLDMDRNPATLRPSIVFGTFTGSNYKTNGVLRIIDGQTCAHQQSLKAPDDAINAGAAVALVDLDNDGDIEIVAAGSAGGAIAFGKGGDGTYARLWTSATCVDNVRTASTPRLSEDAGSISIHDLDDDGVPEVIVGAIVYGADGCVRDQGQGYRGHQFGIMPVLADVDADNVLEWVGGNALFGFVGGKLVPEPGFTSTNPDGYTAVADFGDFGDGAGKAEIVVVSPGSVRVQTITGKVVFGPLSPAGLGGRGGPPTVADFDGDGKPEFAVAGASAYMVFDFECDADPLPAGCAERGVRWRSAIQDASSNITGSSVFDFEGDGRAEAVYADECFLRLYDGRTGAIKGSVSNASGTLTEYPLVADVDGDFHSEIVTGTNDFYATGCPAADPHDATVKYTASHGLHVFRSVGDTWVASRPVWNQHAYSITNIADNGRVPRTSEWKRNWSAPQLNDFRRNIQGALQPLAAPDLTATCTVSKACPAIDFSCRVCNRGAESIAAGVTVAFRTAADAEPFCRVGTDRSVVPGGCATVTCAWSGATTLPRDIRVTVDDNAGAIECREGNNQSVVSRLSCP